MSIPIRKVYSGLANDPGKNNSGKSNLRKLVSYAVLGLVGTGVAGCEIVTHLRPKDKPQKVSELKTNIDKRNETIGKLLKEH